MVLMFVWDAYGNQIGQCNSVVGGKWLEENVLRAFVYVFLILVMKFRQRVVSYRTEEGVLYGFCTPTNAHVLNQVATLETLAVRIYGMISKYE